jgi:hypothetical protein
MDLNNLSTFDNVTFTGYIGIQGGGNVYTGAIRNSRFIGPGTPGSTGLSAFLQLVENTTFTNYDVAAIAGNCGLSVIRDTFTHNHIGLQLGGNPTVPITMGCCGSMNDNVFTDNDIAINDSNGSNQWSNTTIVGSANAPSGQSQIAISGNNSSLWTGTNISGSFSKAVFFAENPTGWTDTFYNTHWTNSYPGSPTHDHKLS